MFCSFSTPYFSSHVIAKAIRLDAFVCPLKKVPNFGDGALKICPVDHCRHAYSYCLYVQDNAWSDLHKLFFPS